jgi:hypothetical protein
MLLGDRCGPPTESRQENQCWPSIGYLADCLGVCRRATYLIIAGLERDGFLKRENRNGRTHYFLAFAIDLRGVLAPGGAPETVPNVVDPGDDDAAEDAAGVNQDSPVIPPREQPCESGFTGGVNQDSQDSLYNNRKILTVRSVPSGLHNGTRIPDDWTPGEAGRQFATDLGLDPQAVFDNFRDYWIAKPGAGGKKADWLATWRTWCRKELERKHRYPVQQSSLLLEDTPEELEAMREALKQQGLYDIPMSQWATNAPAGAGA